MRASMIPLDATCSKKLRSAGTTSVPVLRLKVRLLGQLSWKRLLDIAMMTGSPSSSWPVGTFEPKRSIRAMA